MVNVTGDTTFEPNETFFVTLSNATGAAIGDGQGQGTILNEEGPVLRISDVQRGEGNSGRSRYTFTVTLAPMTHRSSVTVFYATADGSAGAGEDYVTASGTVTLLPGEGSKPIEVEVMGDTLLEANETFVVNLSTATGATIFDPQGQGTILNDEGPVVRITDVSKAEGNSGTSTFVFAVNLTPASSTPVTVNYATANGSASAGSDYTPVPLLPLTFNPGETSKTVVVNVSGDTVIEVNETFFVNLSNAAGATIFDNQGVGTILNEEGSVVRVTDASLVEGASGARLLTFTITVSPPSAIPVTVHYATANGSASAGSDYQALPLSSLTFNAGESSRTVPVVVVGETLLEPDETFFLNLSNVTGATLFDPQGLGTIINDD